MTTNRFHFGLILIASALACGCRIAADDAHTTATTLLPPPSVQRLIEASRPEVLASLIENREPKAAVTILSPGPNEKVFRGSVVILVRLTGAIQSYSSPPRGVPDSQAGVPAGHDHLHVVVDDRPYVECESMEPLALSDIAPGPHQLRVFAARPWHEAYKNDGAFQMMSFTIAGRSESGNSAQVTSASIDPSLPFVTYNGPQGDYKIESAGALMIDFYLNNARLKGEGGDLRIRYYVDDEDARLLDRWEPVWLSGWIPGPHTIHLELLGPDGWPVQGSNGTVSREIRVNK
jgi:hypothetical protein